MTQNDFNDHLEHIKNDGFTILTDQLTPNECAEARSILEARYTEKDRGGYEWLFNKHTVFERFYKLPDLLSLVRYFLGTDALLSAMYGSVVMPGDGGNGLHSDSGITGHNRELSMAQGDEGQRITSHPLAFNVIFCLTPFTDSNGATEFVPRSHKIRSLDIPESAYKRTRTTIAPEGSLVLFNVNTWHGTTRNKTDKPRYAVLSPWRRRWTRCEYEMARVVHPDVLKRAGEDGTAIFGIQAQEPYTELWQWDREQGAPKQEFKYLERH